MTDDRPKPEALPWREGFDVVVLDGLRLRVARWGPDPAGGPAWVLLHEGLGSLPQWRDFPEALQVATGLPVLAYERQGHGASAPFAGPRPLDFIEREGRAVLPRLLERCGLVRPWLFGHSDGGTAALAFGAAHPGHLRGAVVVAAHVLLEPETVAGLERVREAFHHGGLLEGLQRHHGEQAETLFRGWNDAWLDPARRAWDLRPALRSFTAPLLVLQGDRDEYASPTHVDLIADAVGGPVRRHLIRGCRHMPYLQARPEVLAEVRQFLEASGR